MKFKLKINEVSTCQIDIRNSKLISVHFHIYTRHFERNARELGVNVDFQTTYKSQTLSEMFNIEKSGIYETQSKDCN